MHHGDDSEEGEIRPSPPRHSSYDGRGSLDRDRDRGLGANGRPDGLYQGRRSPVGSDSRRMYDGPRELDELYRRLQSYAEKGRGGYMNEPSREVVSQLVDTIRSRMDYRGSDSRGWDRDREYSGSRQGRDRSPDRDRPRIDDRYGYRDSRDRDRWRDAPPRERLSGPSTGIDPSGPSRDQWSGAGSNRGRSSEPPPAPRTDQRLLNAVRTALVNVTRSVAQGPIAAPTPPRSVGHSRGTHESLDDWRRKERARLVSEGTAALHGRSPRGNSVGAPGRDLKPNWSPRSPPVPRGAPAVDSSVARTLYAPPSGICFRFQIFRATFI